MFVKVKNNNILIMKINRVSILNSAEYLLIISTLFYWQSTGYIFNPVAIGLLLILIFQIIFRNKVLGIILPCVLIILSLYMLLALRSELNEFKVFNNEAQTLLLIGLSLFLSIIIVSFLMFFNYFKRFINNETKF